MTFDDAGCAPDQEFEMQPDRTGVIEYTVKYVPVFGRIGAFDMVNKWLAFGSSVLQIDKLE